MRHKHYGTPLLAMGACTGVAAGVVAHAGFWGLAALLVFNGFLLLALALGEWLL